MKGNEIEYEGKLIAVEDGLQLSLNSPFLDRENEILADGSSINPQGNNAFGVAKIGGAELAQLVGHMDKISAKNQPVMLRGAKLFSDGRLIDTGNLFIESAKGSFNRRGTNYQFNFLSADRDDFFEIVKNKNIRELELGGDITITGGNIATWGGLVSGSIGVDFVVNAAAGSGGPPSVKPYADAFNSHTQSALAATAYWAANVVKNGHSHVCFPTVLVYNSDGVAKPVNYWNTADETFVTYEKFTVPMVINTHNFSFSAYTQKECPIVPMYYYHQVLRAIFSENGYELQDDWLLDDEQFNRMALVNVHSILKPMLVNMVSVYGEVGTDANTLYYEKTTVIKPENHLPDMTMAEFLRDCMLKFCIYFEVIGKKVYIRHNELQQAQRELKEVGDKFEIRGERETGAKIAYDLSINSSFKKENAFTEAYTALPDDTVLADLANGALYVELETNSIYRKQSGDDEAVCSNLIPYNSGKSKTHVMPLAPVNCKAVNYEDAVGFLLPGLDRKGFFPYMDGEITGYDTEIYNYEFDHANLATVGIPAISWMMEHYYTLADKVEGSETPANDTKMLGFYYGLQQTLDLIAQDVDVPYLSFHNYIPGQASPKAGNWHLGILGTEGLIETYYGTFINIYNTNRRILLQANENYEALRNHRWNQSIICRGANLYVAVIHANLPLRQFPVYECYEI